MLIGAYAGARLFLLSAIVVLPLAACFSGSARPVVMAAVISGMIAAPGALLSGYRAYNDDLKAQRRRTGRCPRCGYDLRQSTGRCPEWGRPFRRG